jgi:molecular chaperone IbpA
MTRELTLRSLDIPSVHRFGIGFESLLDELMRVSAQQTSTNYPPHNVIRTGDETVTIEIAVAGFDEGEVEINLENRILTVTGNHFKDEPANYEYLHRGLSRRNFAQKFTLAEHVEVMNASNKNGILIIYLERKLPEEKKPKQIAIKYNK